MMLIGIQRQRRVHNQSSRTIYPSTNTAWVWPTESGGANLCAWLSLVSFWFYILRISLQVPAKNRRDTHACNNMISCQKADKRMPWPAWWPALSTPIFCASSMVWPFHLVRSAEASRKKSGVSELVSARIFSTLPSRKVISNGAHCLHSLRCLFQALRYSVAQNHHQAQPLDLPFARPSADSSHSVLPPCRLFGCWQPQPSAHTSASIVAVVVFLNNCS